MIPNGTVKNLSTKSPTMSAESHYSRIHIKTTKNVKTRKLKLMPVGGIFTRENATLRIKGLYDPKMNTKGGKTLSNMSEPKSFISLII